MRSFEVMALWSLSKSLTSASINPSIEDFHTVYYRIILCIVLITSICVLLFVLVYLFVTLNYSVFDKAENHTVLSPTLDLTPVTSQSSPYSQGSPISQLSPKGSKSPLSRKDFYQNFNNSSQYLRRDSFTE